MQAHPARHDPPATTGASCGFCDCRLGKPAVACPSCGARYHEACWRFVLGCPRCGCAATELWTPDELGPYGADVVSSRERWCRRAYAALAALMAVAVLPLALLLLEALGRWACGLPPVSRGGLAGWISANLEPASVLACLLCWPMGVAYGLTWLRCRRARSRSPLRGRLSATNP